MVYLLNSTKRGTFCGPACVCGHVLVCTMKEKEIANKSNWWLQCGFQMVIPVIYPSGRYISDNRRCHYIPIFQSSHQSTGEHVSKQSQLLGFSAAWSYIFVLTFYHRLSSLNNNSRGFQDDSCALPERFLSVLVEEWNAFPGPQWNLISSTWGLSS